ncbi:MAG: MGH1-like glycoside hydrolase domain-containing protein, partial [Cyclobacteriaceae bacterium]
MNSFRILSIYSVIILILSCQEQSNSEILSEEDFRHYIEDFNHNDEELYTQYIPNHQALDFLSENIPLIDIPDKDIEETYYFRWWTYRKHLKKTEDGFVITEFLPPVEWAGIHNTISCPAGHQLYEGRWLRNSRYLLDYTDFWLNKSGDGIRSYSFWAADAIQAFHQIHPNADILKEQLPLLIENYNIWEQTRRDPEKNLFWQIDDRDGMEVSVSGRVLNNGVQTHGMLAIRPTINSYMYGDAKAISAMAALFNNDLVAQEFRTKARTIKNEVQRLLWNNELGFFTVLPKAYTQESKPIAVRELIGYIPWYFNMPDDLPEFAAAWNKTVDTTGFYAPYGLTVCERSHPYFEISYTGHECQWNGPSWPFATTQTLKGMANLLNNYSNHGNISNEDYFELLQQYAKSHSILNDSGEKQKWIDENLNPFTGDWISRTRLKSWSKGTWSKEKGGVERGKDYNHSGFCDLVLSDLLGIKPSMGNQLVLNPLIPDNWDWFCVDKVKYHNRELTVIWDKTGNKYKKGKGLMMFLDGKLAATSDKLGK